MKCFYHQALDAVAICKNCSKGICQDCTTVLLNGVACKDKCEAEVEAINTMINQSKTVYQKTDSAYSKTAVVYLLLGLLFIVTGTFGVRLMSPLAWYLLPAGAIFLIGAVLMYSAGKKFVKSETDKAKG